MFAPVLNATALRLTRRPEDACELVQETFLRAFRTFGNFDGSNAKAWLFRILHSVFVNRYRRRRREPLVSAEEVAERAPEVLHAPLHASSPADDQVASALEALREPFRSAVVLVDVHGHSYREAAQILQCHVNTLRSRLARGRRLLFLRLEDHVRRARLVRR